MNSVDEKENNRNGYCPCGSKYVRKSVLGLLTSVYRGYNNVNCDICFKRLSYLMIVYHCPNGMNSTTHKFGSDICSTCILEGKQNSEQIIQEAIRKAGLSSNSHSNSNTGNNNKSDTDTDDNNSDSDYDPKINTTKKTRKVSKKPTKKPRNTRRRVNAKNVTKHFHEKQVQYVFKIIIIYTYVNFILAHDAHVQHCQPVVINDTPVNEQPTDSPYCPCELQHKRKLVGNLLKSVYKGYDNVRCDICFEKLSKKTTIYHCPNGMNH